MVDVNSSRFDGYRIDEYRARFSGTFDVEIVDGQLLQHGDEVLIVMTAKVGNGVLGETPVGDIRRTNVLKPLEVTFVFNKDRQNELRAEHRLPPVPSSTYVPPVAAPVSSSEMVENPNIDSGFNDRSLEDRAARLASPVSGNPDIDVQTPVEVEQDIDDDIEGDIQDDSRVAPNDDDWVPPVEVFTPGVQRVGEVRPKRDKMLANFLESSLD